MQSLWSVAGYLRIIVGLRIRAVGEHCAAPNGFRLPTLVPIPCLCRRGGIRIPGQPPYGAGLREGSGTVLDNSMIVLGSAIADGNKHPHDNLPVLLSGGGAGKLKPGRHVQFGKGTPMTNLYLSMLDHMGVRTDKLGDSTGKLENV